MNTIFKDMRDLCGEKKGTITSMRMWVDAQLRRGPSRITDDENQDDTPWRLSKMSNAYTKKNTIVYKIIDMFRRTSYSHNSMAIETLSTFMIHTG